MIPDVTGYPLGEARSILLSSGVASIEVKMTVAPRKKESILDDRARVARQRVVKDGSTVELVVCSFHETIE